MKILKIELTNINSLAGSWSIDFTSGAFANTSMYCISGPTGSGKTSILDAICLALYGRTPRQDKINQNKNEVMTYGTKNCSAKVTFECKGIEYCATWEQHRGGRSGNLQRYEWTCVNLSTMETTSHSDQKDIEKETTDLIGLDFSEFTRSMLLAQGEFNKFLKCKGNERAVILEKLTGDEFYRQIAVSVHKLYDAANDTVVRIKDQKKNFQQLSDEDRQALESSIAEQDKQKSALTKTIEKLNAILTWFTQEHDLQARLKTAAESHANAVRAKQGFAASEQMLARAQDAQEVESAFAELATVRTGVKSAKDQLNEQNAKLPGAVNALAEAEQRKSQAGANFEALKKSYADGESLWGKVSELDTKIQGAGKNAGDAANALRTSEGDVRNATQAIADTDEAIRQDTAARQELEAYGKEHAKDAEIEAMLPLLKDKNRELVDQRKKLGDAQKQVKSAQAALDSFDAKNSADRKSLENASAYLEAHGKDADLVNVLLQATSLLNDAVKGQGEVKEHLDEVQKQSKLRDAAKAQVEQLNVSLQGLKDEKEKLIDNDLPVVVVELRENLQEGGACPVCGSTDHPACHGHAEHANHVAEGIDSLGNLAEGLRRLNQQIGDTQGSIATQQSKLEAAASAMETAQGKAQDATQGMERAMDALNQKIAPWGRKAALEDAQDVLNALDALYADFDKQKKEAERLTTALNSAEVQRTKLANDLDQANRDRETAQGKIQELSDYFVEKLSPWFSNVRVEDTDALLKELDCRNAAWNRNRDDLQKTVNRMDSLAAQRKTQCISLEEAKSREAQAKVADEAAKKTLQGLSQERSSLFGDKVVADERNKARNARAEAETAFNDATESVQKLGTDKAKLEESIDGLRKQLAESEPKLDGLQKAFAAQLAAKNFADEKAFVAARLPEAERKRLTELKQKIEQQLTAGATSEKNAADAVGEHATKRDFDMTEDAAKAALDKAKDESKTLTESYAALLSKKQTDDAARKQCASLQQQLDVATAKRAKWEQMQRWFNGNSLTNGSGNEFVKFVQVITLKNLLKTANRHLADMFPRYELITQGEDLDILLIDHDNSDAIRPVSNISGGEGFLVSLSLALAISTMASRNVSIDSMFLDEGFGTLDSNILQATVVALQKMQREKGKMLGVITHVDEVKNELPVHIDVIPLGNGRSKIVLPAA